MPDCDPLDCCPGDNSLDYSITESSLVNLVTSVSPDDGGTTSGDGQYAIGDEVTVVATPGVPTTIDVGVDIVFIADESSGNSDIRALLDVVLPDLDSALQAEG